MELAFRRPENHPVQKMQPGAHPALGQHGPTDSKAVGIKQALNSVFKHLSCLRLEMRKLTGIQNAYELLLIVRLPVGNGLTDFHITQFFLTCIIITWPQILRFWNREFRGS